MKKICIVKIGGNIIDDPKKLEDLLKNFAEISGPKILVHGGGKLATELSEKLGIVTKMHEGRRITDEATLKVTTMVYTGWINKNIAAKLNAYQCKAIGICGADVFIIPSVKRTHSEIDFGFVGDVIEEKINIDLLEMFLEEGMIPVIAPITSDDSGQLLNTNADTIASTLASALSKKYLVDLIYCFEKEGVLVDNEVIKMMNQALFEEMKRKEIVTDGMIPKLENAFHAFKNGVKVTIGHAKNIKQLIEHHGGTNIINS